jgi:hypothetical protein
MKKLLVHLACAATLSCGIGCGTSPAPAPTPQNPSVSKSHGPDHHSHGAGPHGGTLTDWGGGAYHVEFTVDHDKQEAVVYIIGSDEKSAVSVKASKVTLSINDPAFQLDLVAQPLEGESDGLSSRFVGQHENLGKVQEFAGTIFGEVDGTPYSGDFKEEPHGAEHKH